MATQTTQPGTPSARAKSQELYEAATIELASGRPDAAANHLKLALVFDPENEEAQAELDRIPFADRSPPPPSSPRAEQERPMQKAREAEQAGDVRAAMSHLKRGLHTRYRASCAHRLGQLVLQHRQDEERALELFRVAMEAAPQNAAFRRSYERLRDRRSARGGARALIDRWFGRTKPPRT
jgi:tetratricopeptide (TPR) repeat protein